MDKYEQAGISWWNDLSEDMRRYWMDLAQSSVPAVAYQVYLAVQADAYARSFDGGFDA